MGFMNKLENDVSIAKVATIATIAKVAKITNKKIKRWQQV